jgi:thymidylate kinase
MGRVVKRIVLTGGPCAGKSSSLELIKNYLSDKGYVVYVVQESATELINSGIKPFGDNNLSMVEFQEVILKYQLYKEDLVETVAKNYKTDKDIVIIYDRGVLDNKAYISQEEFDNLLTKYNLKEINLLNRYDYVIHLETAAKGNSYTLENNKARSEDKNKAIEMDYKTYNAWKNHRNLVKVNCYDKFVDKQNQIINIVDNNMFNIIINVTENDEFLNQNIIVLKKVFY